jgi:prepilin-type N-terminal cleavage/methylation domain-containing protein
MSSNTILNRQKLHGFTLIELVVSVAMGAVILAAMSGLLDQVLQTDGFVRAQNDRQQDGRFAMQRMATAVLGTQLLILPTADNPNTTTHPLNAAVLWNENIREQTVPATAGREFETAVLVVALGSAIDTDQDGFADADNDRDGRLDEDSSWDRSRDGEPGILGIDDDGDGSIDEGHFSDDDEDGNTWEDPFNNIDDDADGRIDEDTSGDQNQDGWPGVVSFDDDSDGSTDEGFSTDDDEDGRIDEDWPDALVFFLQGDSLIERRPNIHASSGTDYVENTIAENVVGFRVERIAQGTGRAVTVQLTLEQSSAVGDNIVLDTLLRVGGGS